ncbi:MAG TPA: DUF4112 domain-containing protein [Qipengyuania sp.]|nr:DUF4112 domain-containing protein [Qipengyuania sp.]
MDDFKRPLPLGIELPTGRAPADVRRRMEAMERLLERSLTIPGTKVPVGLDSVVGLIPVVGDAIAAALGAYLLWEAKNLGLPKWKLWRMAGNIAFDAAVGAVPVAGDLFDFVFRSNSRNLRIVKRHLDRHHPETRVIEG